MVWVDAVATAVGLLVFVGTVAGVVVLEHEPEETTWSVDWFEGKEAFKSCMGCEPSRVGAKGLDLDPAPEDSEIALPLPNVTQDNITRVRFILDWVDDRPADDDGKEHKYEYTNASRDRLRLTVVTPWGENVSVERDNDMPLSRDDPAIGRIVMEWNFTLVPEVKKWGAYTMQDAHLGLMANNTVSTYDHLEADPLGAWRAWVTVVRAGDQEGTVPADLCHSERLGTDVPPDVEEAIPEDVAGQTSPKGHYEKTCDTGPERKSNEGPIPKDFQGQKTYRSTYVDDEQVWVAQMELWSYSALVSF